MTLHTRDYVANPDTHGNDPRWAYLEWLSMEARLLRMELQPRLDPDMDFSPVNTFAHSFHIGDGNWRALPMPSTRALHMLRAAGVAIPGEVVA